MIPIEYAGNRIALFLLQSGIVEKENAEIIAYGAKVILSFMAALITFIVISMFTNQIDFLLTFVIVFCSLRSFAGGYHAKSFAGCYVRSVGIFLILVFLNAYTSYAAKAELIFPIMTAGNLFLLLTAPSQNLVNPKTKEELRENRKKMIFVLLLTDIIVITCVSVGLMTEICFAIGCTIMTIAILSVVNLVQGYSKLKIHKGC